MPTASHQQPQAPQTHDMRRTAALLNTGRTRLLRWLRDHQIVYKDRDGNILPNRRYVAAGYLVTKMHQVPLGNTGMIRLSASTLVTDAGILWLQKKIEQERTP